MRRVRVEAATAGFLPLVRAARPNDGRLLVGEAPQVRRRRPGVRWRWGRYLVLGVAVYCAYVGRAEWLSWQRLGAQASALAAQEASLRRQQAELHADIAYANSSAYVESQARQLFGLVSPGEVPLAPAPAEPPSSSAAGPGPAAP